MCSFLSGSADNGPVQRLHRGLAAGFSARKLQIRATRRLRSQQDARSLGNHPVPRTRLVVELLLAGICLVPVLHTILHVYVLLAFIDV